MIEKKLRIVNIMFSTSDRPFGTEKASYKYTEMFLKNGHEVLFIHRHSYDLDYLDTGHKRLACHQMKTRHFIDLLKTRKKIKKYKPDIIIAHNNFSRFMLSCKGIAPMVGVAHLGRFSSLKFYNGAIAFRPDLADFAYKTGIPQRKIGLIENTSNLDKMLPTRSAFRSSPVIGAMGFFSSHKNFALYIRALKILLDRNIAFKAILAGSGEQESELRALSASYGLDEKLTFPGYIKDTNKFYDSIDICCVPSTFELFSLVILDAMAARKPIVASNIPNFLLVLDKGRYGRLFDVSSATALADALQKMLTSPSESLRFGALAGDYYDKKYSEDVIYKKLHTFLLKTINKV